MRHFDFARRYIQDHRAARSRDPGAVVSVPCNCMRLSRDGHVDAAGRTAGGGRRCDQPSVSFFAAIGSSLASIGLYLAFHHLGVVAIWSNCTLRHNGVAAPNPENTSPRCGGDLSDTDFRGRDGDRSG